MDPANYYITTLIAAFKNLAPLAAFLIGGYLIFIKMPFLFLKKSMDDQKKKLMEEDKKLPLEEKYSVEDYLAFQKRLKLMSGGAHSEKKDSSTKEQQKKTKSDEKTSEKTQKKQQPPPRKPIQTTTRSAEEIFNFRPNEKFSKGELKKRYFELLKENHPDRVASMGQDFKKLAEKNTKDINKAYDVLKNKAS